MAAERDPSQVEMELDMVESHNLVSQDTFVDFDLLLPHSLHHASCLPFQVRPHARQPRQLILHLCQFHLLNQQKSIQLAAQSRPKPPGTLGHTPSAPIRVCLQATSKFWWTG